MTIELTSNLEYLLKGKRGEKFFYDVAEDIAYYQNPKYHKNNEVEVFTYSRNLQKLPGDREIYYLSGYYRSDVKALDLRLKYFGIKNYRIFRFVAGNYVVSSTFYHLEILDESDTAVFKLHFHEKIQKSHITDTNMWFSGTEIKEEKFKKSKRPQ